MLSAAVPTTINSTPNTQWISLQELRAQRFQCGYCGHIVSSDRGYGLMVSSYQRGGIYVCPDCKSPTFQYPSSENRVPGTSFGHSVGHLPAEIQTLYEEARTCTSNACFTGAVLLLRKLLMNIAVAQGASEGLTFFKYVDYLSEKGFIPPNGKHWVDHIRKKGNEATHEIVQMTSSDAQDLITFMEMLLRFIFEFPSSIPPPPKP